MGVGLISTTMAQECHMTSSLTRPGPSFSFKLRLRLGLRVTVQRSSIISPKLPSLATQPYALLSSILVAQRLAPLLSSPCPTVKTRTHRDTPPTCATSGSSSMTTSKWFRCAPPPYMAQVVLLPRARALLSEDAQHGPLVPHGPQKTIPNSPWTPTLNSTTMS